MCRQRKHQEHGEAPIGATQARGPYEGRTIRLGAAETAPSTCATRWRAGHFPWWMLWLIWPLMGLLRGVVASLRDIGAFALTALPDISHMAGFWPILLILIGIILWRRR